MFRDFKQQFTHNLINIPGWHTNRKIVVIESDDWGSIRMPSKAVYNQLFNEGYKPDTDAYLKFDSLASEQDLSDLFEVLSSVKDKNGNPVVITANCIMANPDFKKIKESGFEIYHYELFTETLKRYPNHRHSFKLWQEGMQRGIFQPQFHGREHLNVDQWMKGLKEGDKMLHKAFEHEMISISSIPSKMRFGYMEALDFFDLHEKQNKETIIKDGLHFFEQVFGFKSSTFIASCYIWHNDFEKALFENGVHFIQGIPIQLQPSHSPNSHSLKRMYHFTGQKNKTGQTYLVRNVHFEPTQVPDIDIVNECLSRIEIAFRWHKPAIISSHRLNFIGAIEPDNSSRNLKLFQSLLNQIVKIWPDVEFMTSSQLGQIINNQLR